MTTIPPSLIDQVKKIEGVRSRDSFEWDPKNDRYICPDTNTRTINREQDEDARQIARRYS